jgi:CBS domain-containing protein
MKKREPVSRIMTSQVVVVNENESLKNVVNIIRKHKIRHLPVVSGRELIGIVSRTDLNRLSFSGLFEGQEGADEAVLEMINLKQVMSHKPRVVNKDDLIKDVAEIFASEEFHALPVVDENMEIQGIVTTTDIIKYMLEQY